MPAAKLAPDLALRQPYPGLRPFETQEAVLFFGRETHTADLLRRLSEQRFLAVVGSSGSGKSSLVRAGLLPALYRGRLVGATSLWRMCVMRPGSAPLDNLAKCLSEQGIGSAPVGELRDKLGRSCLGLTRAVRETNLAEGESVLLVVDQFEELFRFANERREKDGGAEARLLVASLLEATDASTAPLYVVLTMRSDFLGDCTQFPGLPDALNRSQYLIPQLTREQVRDSIEKPARLVGTEMNSRLVERVLNDLGDDAGALPVLQHALNRTYLEFLKQGGDGDILIRHYADAGTLSDALDKHAGEVFSNLSEEAQPWTQRVFRALTMEEGNRKIRRPVSLLRLYWIAGAIDAPHQKLVREVVEAYASRDNSLLVCSGDQMIDISHESLITHWQNLNRWSDDEAKSASWYKRAADDTARHLAGEARTWRDPELALVMKNLQSRTWNPAWAERQLNTKATFAEVKAYLEQGDAEQRKERAEEAERAAQRLADAAALIEAAELKAEAEKRAKEEAEGRTIIQRRSKEDFQALALAERRAREEAEGRARAEERAKTAAEALVRAQRRANRLLTVAGIFIVALSGWIIWSQIQIRKSLEKASNTLLSGQGELQAKLGKDVKAKTNPKDGLSYVFIPPGSFKMGCSVGDSDCASEENPAHDVKIPKGFWLGQTDVTQSAWRKIMNTDPSHFKGDQFPVESVSWNEAVNYCKAIGGRLPAEAEWEYAARAGSNSARYGELDSIAWYSGNSGGTTHAVATKQPNQFGLYDMLGNVWEWVQDGYVAYKPEANAMNGTYEKVARGGSWYVGPQYVRASDRYRYPPANRNINIGFRCVWELSSSVVSRTSARSRSDDSATTYKLSVQ